MVFCAILWSTGGVFSKGIVVVDAGGAAAPLVSQGLITAGGRSLVVVLVLMVFVHRRLHLTLSWPVFLGALALALNFLCYNLALRYTTAANVLFLQYTAPLFVILLGWWLLREKPSRLDWMVLAVVFSGLGLFFIGKLGIGGAIGNLLGLSAGFLFGCFFVFSRQMAGGNPIEMVILANLFTVILTLPLWFTAHPAPVSWGLLLAMGSLQTALPYILYVAAIRKVPAVEASLIAVIEPLLAPVWTFVLPPQEIPSAWALLGGAVVLAAVTVRGILVARRGNN
jgi:drug/metabolite transporter (DMT)-like permease